MIASSKFKNFLSPKSFSEKKVEAIPKKDLFDDDFKESVKVTSVQKCDFSQSWTLYFQIFQPPLPKKA